MLILGKTNDDKGTQLENLTRSILSELKYTNIVCNEIRIGGEEIDISAEIEVSRIGKSQIIKLICECKAYKNPVDINAWLKFLGKMYTAEKSEPQTVYGCFVALNGVNGNVAGHYKGIEAKTGTIDLVTGEELLKHISNIYKLCDLKTIQNIIQNFTNRQVISYEQIAYYDNQVFRIVTFETNSYTIIRGDGQPITREVFNSLLKDLVEIALPARNFIDLQEESEAIKKVIRTKKFVIAQLFLSNGTIARNSFPLVNEFIIQEINDAIEELCEQGWLRQNDNSETLFINNENSSVLYAVLVEIYNFLLEDEITDWVFKALESEYHINHINEHFVSEIQRIQGNLLLSPKEVEQAILLLRWSPGALAWSLYPQEVLINITQIDIVDIGTQEKVDYLRSNYFISNLYALLKNDFYHPAFKTHFYTVYNLIEIESIEELNIKSFTKIELKGELKSKVRILALKAEYINSDVDQLIKIIPLSSSEPWESTTESVEKSFET